MTHFEKSHQSGLALIGFETFTNKTWQINEDKKFIMQNAVLYQNFIFPKIFYSVTPMIKVRGCSNLGMCNKMFAVKHVLNVYIMEDDVEIFNLNSSS